MNGREEWELIAATNDADELRERIFTGYKTGKPFTPYVPTVALPSKVSSVLDFGCGVGRNFPFLKSIARQVVGFDLEPMIARCRSLAPESIDLLTSDWEDVSRRQFDLVFASLVLQHIDTDACRTYLADFAKMVPARVPARVPAIYVLTRLQSDFGMNVLGLVAESGLFEVTQCAEVEHDLETNELRQVRARSFAEVSRATDNLHYEVLLIPRLSS
jgi:SAM-dependent methyltransferase